MLNAMYSGIGPAGAALLMGGLVLFTALSVVFGGPKLRGAGFVLGFLFVVCGFLLTPVYTDSPVPPISLQLIPLGCILAVFTLLPPKVAAGPAIAAAVLAVSIHQAWMDRAFPGYLNAPRRASTYAKQEMKRAAREFQMYAGSLDPHKPMKAGFLDEPPYVDELNPKVFKLAQVVAVPEWHTPITGLYRDASTPIRLWTNGGLPDQATIESKPYRTP